MAQIRDPDRCRSCDGELLEEELLEGLCVLCREGLPPDHDASEFPADEEFVGIGLILGGGL